MNGFDRDNDENKNDQESSVYSYNYRDREKNSTVHDGDYDASRNTDSYGYRADDYKSENNYSYKYDEAYDNKPRRQKRSRGRDVKKSGDRFGVNMIKCVIFAAVFGLVAGGIFYGINHEAFTVAKMNNDEIAVNTVPQQIEPTDTEDVNIIQSVTVSDVSGIVDEVMPSIVAITNMSETEYYTIYGQSRKYDSESCGSGIIISDDDDYIYIATNNHVVTGATTLTVTLVDETTVTAEVKGTDSDTDLAVVSVKKGNLKSDTLSAIRIAAAGDSDSLKVGETAIAIGNALGYGQSVTTGVISAVNREVTIQDSESGEYITNDLIQTDAAINPGNSGGALLNVEGKVIGINSVKYADTYVEGMGYAIPISTAMPIIEELIDREVVDESQSAFLGIVGVDVTSDISSSYNMPEGVYIAQVAEGSAAESAGIIRGDILTTFAGHSISSMEELEEQLQYHAAGTTVEITVMRANNGVYMEKDFEVILGSKK